ncbi:hypothetical protein BDK51DRAFT_37093 [Blyttiomyces helicus]|uniref:Uncharacterized protein n=1 Tax=Blyttiomyces helicus TaxID=388810 RepID=A0A4P9WSH8_9FUNG|nr:hypothetical protein BDK51DRAFT_37093 [Blyttiomyces helicus]|eukprot:RKO94260.1 hypothetical protein BDK51DRAFT_37093 [Blyttiomyces helicus]
MSFNRFAPFPPRPFPAFRPFGAVQLGQSSAAVSSTTSPLPQPTTAAAPTTSSDLQATASSPPSTSTSNFTSALPTTAAATPPVSTTTVPASTFPTTAVPTTTTTTDPPPPSSSSTPPQPTTDPPTASPPASSIPPPSPTTNDPLPSFTTIPPDTPTSFQPPPPQSSTPPPPFPLSTGSPSSSKTASAITSSTATTTVVPQTSVGSSTPFAKTTAGIAVIAVASVIGALAFFIIVGFFCSQWRRTRARKQREKLQSWEEAGLAGGSGERPKTPASVSSNPARSIPGSRASTAAVPIGLNTASAYRPVGAPVSVPSGRPVEQQALLGGQADYENVGYARGAESGVGGATYDPYNPVGAAYGSQQSGYYDSYGAPQQLGAPSSSRGYYPASAASPTATQQLGAPAPSGGYYSFSTPSPAAPQQLGAPSSSAGHYPAAPTPAPPLQPAQLITPTTALATAAPTIFSPHRTSSESSAFSFRTLDSAEERLSSVVQGAISRHPSLRSTMERVGHEADE